jgi:anthranilate synthase/aminodeoxychorismate synthase-like glutamine amidotransferase
MIAVIDNYDSFTYNLVQYLGELGARVEVHRNDTISVEALEARDPEGILISPGPGTPDEAGISLDAIRHFAGKRPLLGVCLGHQGIGQVFGGRVIRAGRLMHGRTSPIEHDGRGLFAGLPSPFTATRYHSLIVERSSLPAELEISAWTAEGEIMGLRHRRFAVEAVQFHPESFLTEHGHAMLQRFLQMLPEQGRRAAPEAA